MNGNTPIAHGAMRPHAERRVHIAIEPSCIHAPAPTITTRAQSIGRAHVATLVPPLLPPRQTPPDVYHEPHATPPPWPHPAPSSLPRSRGHTRSPLPPPDTAAPGASAVDPPSTRAREHASTRARLHRGALYVLPTARGGGATFWAWARPLPRVGSEGCSRQRVR